MELISKQIYTPPKESRQGMWEVKAALGARQKELAMIAMKDNERGWLAADAMREAIAAAFCQL